MIQEEVQNIFGQYQAVPRSIKPWHIESVYGSMYADNVTQLADITVIGTHVELTGGFTAGSLDGVEFGDSHYLKPHYGGKFFICWSLSIDTSAGSDEVEAGLFLNGVEHVMGSAHSTIAANSLATTLGGNIIMPLAANDEISLGVANHTATRDVTMQHGSCSMIRVGR